MSDAGTDGPQVDWVKSSHSTVNGQCIELARIGTEYGIRDSKLGPESDVLMVTRGGLEALKGLATELDAGTSSRPGASPTSAVVANGSRSAGDGSLV